MTTPREQLEALQVEAVRSRGFLRAAETQLEKVVGLLQQGASTPESRTITVPANTATILLAHPDDVQRVKYTVDGKTFEAKGSGPHEIALTGERTTIGCEVQS